MATTPLQTAQADWRRRASVFAQQGVPQETWAGLYQRDMAGVYQGNQPMSDAEVYAGVKSAVAGPQIQDPQPAHGTGGGIKGILSGIGDTIGNIPSDIGGIITGAPHGIAHAIWDLPHELPDTMNLITHLGDNQWLIDNGYLNKGDQVHGMWGEMGAVLQAMNAKQSDNLLPYIPLLSDIANMTSGQGRAYLMQHPVGSLLDAWPGITKAGKLAVAGKDLGATAESMAGLASGESKFVPAQRALQQGSPIRALLSAAGSAIPYGKDELGQTLNLRDHAMHIAKIVGIDGPTMRLAGGYQIGTSEYKAQIEDFVKKEWSSPDLANITPEQQADLMWGASGNIDPRTMKPFPDQAARNDWISSLPAPQRALIDQMTNISEATKAYMTGNHLAVEFTDMNGVQRLESPRSAVYKAYKRWVDAKEQKDNYTRDVISVMKGQNRPLSEVATVAKHSMELTKKMNQAERDYHDARLSHVPLHGQMAADQIRRQNMKDAVTQNPELLEHDKSVTTSLPDALKTIAQSQYMPDFVRLFGQDKFDEFTKDAIKEWDGLQKTTGRPIMYIPHLGKDQADNLLNPHVDPAKGKYIPRQTKEVPGKDLIFTHRSIMNPMVALTHAQAEVFKHDVMNKFYNDSLVGMKFVQGKDQIMQGYSDAIRKANANQHLNMSEFQIAATARKLYTENYEDFKPSSIGATPEPQTVGEMAISKDAMRQLRKITEPANKLLANKGVRMGTEVYKLSVLTGPRHLAHVGLGGLAFLEMRYPLAPRQFAVARQLLRGELDPRTFGLEGINLSGLRSAPFHLGKSGAGQMLENAWSHSTGEYMGEALTIEGIHEVRTKAARAAGKSILEWIPNKLAAVEESLGDMYRVSAYLEERTKGVDVTTALEMANKTFVDINNMSVMERNVIKQLFPFYAFTRHLFRYLFTFPVDHPLRASIMSNFGEGEQRDWTNGLPRTWQSLFFLPFGKHDLAIDTKNLNPFRSFGNDFSFSGFYSSLSPFLSAPLQAIGVDTLSGTTQLYPGSTYNPLTGTMQATMPGGTMGGLIAGAESFVPQLGLLDHYMGLTAGTRAMKAFNPDAYQKQLYNMLNLPFVPNVVDVPYEQEIREMRRFRAAQAAVTAVQKNPSAANVAKLMEWNAVPFNNELVSPGSLAAYYQQYQAALDAAGQGGISPKAVSRKPVARKAVYQNF